MPLTPQPPGIDAEILQALEPGIRKQSDLAGERPRTDEQPGNSSTIPRWHSLRPKIKRTGQSRKRFAAEMETMKMATQDQRMKDAKAKRHNCEPYGYSDSARSLHLYQRPKDRTRKVREHNPKSVAGPRVTTEHKTEHLQPGNHDAQGLKP